MRFRYPPNNTFLFILLNAFIIYFLSFIVSILPFSESLHNPITEDLKTNKIEALFLILFLGPLFETLIFQALVISIVRYFLLLIESLERKTINIIAILISALSFGVVHTYNLTYAVVGFFVGIIFAYSYVYIKEKKSNPIIIVFLIHFLTNLLTYLHNTFFGDL